VVVNGNFKIDSALQIQAKPSMMSPEGGVTPAGHAHHGDMAIPKKATKAEEKDVKDHEMKESKNSEVDSLNTPKAFREQIDSILTVYFRIQGALVQDNAKTVQGESKKLQKALDAVDMGLLTGHAHMVWMKDLEELTKQAKAMKGTSDIKKQREAFYLLSESLTSVIKRFKTSGAQAVLQFRCPMAFGDRGAHWLQNKRGVQNPYFGQMMIKCGEQTATLVTLSK
jgi:Cu(I)/Ag(I) efflux system membrane fusion protein